MPRVRAITKGQARAARGFIGWTTKQLAEKAGVSINTVSRFENGNDVQLESAFKLQEAFEQAGIEFPDEFTVSYRGEGQ